MSASGPSLVEKPSPRESSPVDCSSTSTVTTVLSGAEPAALVTSTFLKKPEILDALLRALHLLGVEGIALDELKLAADHLVEGAHVANDVDPLDIDPRALLHIESDVDRVVRRGCA